mgnify:FL=1
MIYVTFEQWISTLRKSANCKGITLISNDSAYLDNYERGESPKGTLALIETFGEA